MHSGNKNTGLQSVICNSGVQNTLVNYFLCVCLPAVWRQTCRAAKVTDSRTCPGQSGPSSGSAQDAQAVCPHACSGSLESWELRGRSESDTQGIHRVWGKGLQAYISK